MSKLKAEMEELGINFSSYFETSESQVSVDELVQDVELSHYIILLEHLIHLNVAVYQRSKEQIIHMMLSTLILSNNESVKYTFNSSWPFPIVIKLDKAEKLVQVRPRSDMLLCIRRFPIMIMEIASGTDGKDGFRMMLHAGALTRILQCLGVDPRLVIVGIYIDDSFKATRYLFSLSDPMGEEVIYIKKEFDLGNKAQALMFLSELYRMVIFARHPDSDILEKNVDEMVNEIQCMRLDPITSTQTRERQDNSGKDGRSKRLKPSGGNDKDNAMNDAIVEAGYALAWHHLPQGGKDKIELPFLFPDNVREAMRRDGLPVIIKRVKYNSEVDILAYLGSRGGGSNHIIALLEVLKCDTQWLIVMPKHVKLREAAHLLLTPATVYSFQKQFLQGVAFMHANGVVHLDLKPDNVVIDFGERRRSRSHEATLYIIDFGIAEMNVTASTTVDDVCGTRGWTAPEIQEDQSWSPILADRWACGKVLLYLGEQINRKSGVQELVRRLMDDNPQARPPVSLVLEGIFGGSECQVMAG